MRAWQIPYLGRQRLPADLSSFQIEHFFTLRAEERRCCPVAIQVSTEARRRAADRLSEDVRPAAGRRSASPGTTTKAHRRTASRAVTRTSPRFEDCMAGAAEPSTSIGRGRSSSSA